MAVNQKLLILIVIRFTQRSGLPNLTLYSDRNSPIHKIHALITYNVHQGQVQRGGCRGGQRGAMPNGGREIMIKPIWGDRNSVNPTIPEIHTLTTYIRGGCRALLFLMPLSYSRASVLFKSSAWLSSARELVLINLRSNCIQVTFQTNSFSQFNWTVNMSLLGHFAP